MNVRDWNVPFRVGATSYVVEDGLVENAEFLASHVQDMQLVLFDIPGGPSNLPDAAAVNALAVIGARRDFTYTVHLLDDLISEEVILRELSTGELIAEEISVAGTALHPSLQAARMLIERTRALTPWAWVGHLDGRSVREQSLVEADLAPWWNQAVCAVEQVAAWIDDPACLAIENLEGYPPDFVTPVVTQTRAGRCVDVGHLWLDDRDPIFHLRAAARLRVIHLHGVSEQRSESHRDHRSLALVAPETVDRVIHYLLRTAYAGVLTLEVFGAVDFWSSLDALHASIRRYQEN